MDSSPDKNLLRGNLDLILLSILEDGSKYGLQIIQEAGLRTNGYLEFKEGSLYPALHRLEKAKLIRAEFRPSDTGGPRRRYYQLSEAGQKKLLSKRAEFDTFNQKIKALWEGS